MEEDDAAWVERVARGESEWSLTAVPSAPRLSPASGRIGRATKSLRRPHSVQPSASAMSHSPRHPENRGNNFNVVIRVRPPVARELQGYLNICHITPESPTTITLCDAVETADGRSAVYARQSFTFDAVFDEHTDQEALYAGCARAAVLSVLKGFNGTLIAYGQTGTGKTYTMEGFTDEKSRGIIPRAVEDIFYYMEATKHAEAQGIPASQVLEEAAARTSDTSPNTSPPATKRKVHTEFVVQASYMQIYNEVLSDLLVEPTASPAEFQRGTSSPRARPLVIRHTPQDGVYVEGLSQWIVESEEDVYALIERGTAHRATSATKLSELSSRSHAIFTLLVEATCTSVDGSAPEVHRVGKLHIVDLAGSEKVRHTGVTGQRLEETKKINKSLHELGNVISALAKQHASPSVSSARRSMGTTSSNASTPMTTPRGSSLPPPGAATHIPFRNSVLTSVLRDSLGGNCITTLIACLSPSLEAYAESLSTLSFANRAKNIRNHAVANIGFRQPSHGRSQGLNGLDGSAGTRALQLATNEAEQAALVMDRRRREAEEQRGEALKALAQRTREQEEERKRRLALEAQLAEQQEQLQRLKEQGEDPVGAPRAPRADAGARASERYQVERYKQLLLKQRDIMLSLTTRLNERDEIILHLEYELELYRGRVDQLERDQQALAAAPREPSPSLPLVSSANGGGAEEEPTPSKEVRTQRPSPDNNQNSHEDQGESAASTALFPSSDVVTTTTPHSIPHWLCTADGREKRLLEFLEKRSAALAAQRVAAVEFPQQKCISRLLLERQHLRQRCDSLFAALLRATAAAPHPRPARKGLDGELDSAESSVSTLTAASSLSHTRRSRRLSNTSTTGGSSPKRLSHTVQELELLLKSTLQSFEEALEREHVERWRLSKKVEQLQRRTEAALLLAAHHSPLSSAKESVRVEDESSTAAAVWAALLMELERAEEEILRPVQMKGQEAYHIATQELHNTEGSPLAEEQTAVKQQWEDIFEQQQKHIETLEHDLSSSRQHLRLAQDAQRDVEDQLRQQQERLTRVQRDAQAVALGRVEDPTAALQEQLETFQRDRRALLIILETKLLRRVDSVLGALASSSSAGDATSGKELRMIRTVLCSTIEALREEESSKDEEEEEEVVDGDGDERSAP